LYIKQLIKYKRNTEALLAAQKHAQEAQIRYSVELHRTLRSPEDFARISEYLPHEAASAGLLISAKHWYSHHKVYWNPTFQCADIEKARIDLIGN